MIRIYQNSGLLYLNGNPFKPSDIAIEFVTNGRNAIVRNAYNRTDILIDPTEITKIFKEDGITAYTSMAEMISELPLVFENAIKVVSNSGESVVTNSNFSYNASGGQRVSQMTTMLDGKVLGEDDVELFENVGTGTATYANNKVNLSVGSGEYMIRQSKRSAPYFSGKPQFVEFTCDNFQGELDVYKRIGYFSSNAVSPYNSTLDGIYLEDVGSVKSLVCERAGTETVRIPFTAMDNYDKISSYNWENFTVCAIDFIWLGGAVLRFFVKTQTGFELIHTENYAGTQKDVFILSPNQPIRYEVRSVGGTGSLRYICCNIATEGSINESGKTLALYNPTGVTTNTVGTIYALKGVKKQVAFRDVAIQIIEISATSTATNDAGLLLMIKNPTLSAPLSYSNNKKVQEADGTGQTITAGSGWVVGSISKGREAGSTSTLKDNFLAFLSHEINNTMDEYVLAFMPVTNNQVQYGIITIKIF